MNLSTTPSYALWALRFHEHSFEAARELVNRGLLNPGRESLKDTNDDDYHHGHVIPSMTAWAVLRGVIKLRP